MAVSGVLGRTHGEGGFEIQRTSGEEHPQRGGQNKGWRVWKAECWGEQGGVSRGSRLETERLNSQDFVWIKGFLYIYLMSQERQYYEPDCFLEKIKFLALGLSHQWG